MAPYYNIIYNISDGTVTEDSTLALEFVEFLVQKLSGWGYEGYFADRDAIPGRSIFDELFRIVSATEKTIVVITPEFRTIYWAKYSKQAAFKYLIDQSHQHKLIPIAVNIGDNRSLEELNVNQPIHINGQTEAEWDSDNNKRCFNRLKMAFGPPNQARVVEETGDNRLRTEVQQQLVTRPCSERSLSLIDERNNSNCSLSEGYRSDLVHEQALPDPRILSMSEQQNTLQLSRDSQSLLAYDGDIGTTDTEVLPVDTAGRLFTEENPTTLKRLWNTRGTVEQGLPSSYIINIRNGQVNGEMAAPHGHESTSISDDTDLSMDMLRSSSVPQGTNEEITHDSSEPRPETRGAEGASVTRPELAKLSFGSLEQDDRSEEIDLNQTFPKDVSQPESGYTTLSDNTPSSAVDYQLENQTDDAKSSMPSPDRHSNTSPTGGSDRSDQSTRQESGASGNVLRKIGFFCQTVTKCALNIEKAYQN